MHELKLLNWDMIDSLYHMSISYMNTCVPREDSNQPAHPHSLIRQGVLRIAKDPKRLQAAIEDSDKQDAQAGLSLRWTHM